MSVKSDPVNTPTKITHTRRPALKTRDSLPETKRRHSLTKALKTTTSEEPESTGHLTPSTKDTKQVQFNLTPGNDSAIVPTPKIKPTFQVPNRRTDRFKWIHGEHLPDLDLLFSDIIGLRLVPCNDGHHILGAILTDRVFQYHSITRIGSLKS